MSTVPLYQVDAFSARWTRYVDLPAARSVQFDMIGDDGMRVLVDGQAIMEDWHDHPTVHNTAVRTLSAGKHLIVVDKAAGALTVPANSGETDSVMHAITRYLSHRGTRDRAQPVHRLDRGASGLLIFGKNREIAAELQKQFEERMAEREYMAIVNGHLPHETGTFESYITTSQSLQQYSTTKPGEGQLAITHYRAVDVARGATFVRVWLETGRRNQIRVHFAEAGFPVLGDPRYRPDGSAHPHWRDCRG